MSPFAKLVFGATVVACASAYLAYLGASSSWQYYLVVDECVASRDQLVRQRMRVSGQIAPGSLQIHADRRRASFVLRGQRSEISVSCHGPLPDNLQEGIDVVVEGMLLESGILQGDKVLTRCASKYEANPQASSKESG
jgi:cytochrome c-type biogenesis protein CcmE